MKNLKSMLKSKKPLVIPGVYDALGAKIAQKVGFDAMFQTGYGTSATLFGMPDYGFIGATETVDNARRICRAVQVPVIVDSDTGYGNALSVWKLVKELESAGASGIFLEDQRWPKRCGHMQGKEVVPQEEYTQKLSAAIDARENKDFIIVARTDAEAANLLDGRGDERDHPFILGATNTDVPGYKNCYLAILKRFYDKGITDVNGHKLYNISEDEYEQAYKWFDQVGLTAIIDESIQALKDGKERSISKPLDNAASKFVEIWEAESALMTFAQAVAEKMEFQIEEGRDLDMTIEEWLDFAKQVSFHYAREKARLMGIEASWDCELSRTPEGYYQVKGGIEYAIAKSIAVAPYADLIWTETKTANLEEAREFAEAIHEVYPDKMFAYNLSPSFNWDTTGMTEDEMRIFPKEIGKLGFVFDFITYGGHQIDGLAAEEFSTALQQDGMLALARLQRKFRLVDSPYKTPQSLVGGPRMDSALAASSGRTATTKAMGKGSTQVQHLVETEVPPRLLEQWLEIWRDHYNFPDHFRVQLRPHTAGSELLELAVFDEGNNKIADVIFSTIHDRMRKTFISVRDQNTFDAEYRQKRLNALLSLFLIHRYKGVAIHYVSPTADNQMQTKGMQKHGIFGDVHL